MAPNSKCLNKPKPQRGPDVPYHNQTSSNPVLRGFLLAPLAILSSTWLQSLLWNANNFNKLRDITGLDAYSPRYDPTVIPVSDGEEDAVAISDLRVRPRKNANQYYTCADYHELYKSGQLTPLEVAEYLVFLTFRPNNRQAPDRFSVAYISTRAELVLAAARESTERYERGQPLSVLDGVLVAVKDEIELHGYRKTQGSAVDFTGPHNETGWCVRQWQEAGAVVVGKTNMHEMGLDTNGYNFTWGTPLNPHNEDYYTGGSSSGSACTVAQGVVPIALGADGGGSIRLPASFCGVYGLKPTHGRVSGRPTADLAHSVGVYGPIASSLDDLTIAYRIMAQPDPDHEPSSLFPHPLNTTILNPPTSTTPKLLGIDHTWISRSDPAVLHLFTTALTHYTHTLDYTAIPITLPHLPASQKSHALTILSEIRSGLSPSHISHLSYQNQILLSATGSQASAVDFLAAQRLRDLMMKHLAWLWEEYPGMVVLTPTTPCAGWKVGKGEDVRFGGFGVSDSDMSVRTMEFVFLANWVGCPALTVPVGYTEEEEVPVGVMVMGEWGAEEQLLAWAKEGEGFFLGGEDGGIRRPRREGHWCDVPLRAREMNK